MQKSGESDSGSETQGKLFVAMKETTKFRGVTLVAEINKNGHLDFLYKDDKNTEKWFSFSPKVFDPTNCIPPGYEKLVLSDMTFMEVKFNDCVDKKGLPRSEILAFALESKYNKIVLFRPDRPPNMDGRYYFFEGQKKYLSINEFIKDEHICGVGY